MTPPRVLIVGAGFAGFHCARELERLLRPSEATDVAPHVLPELGGKLSATALGRLRQRGIDVRLGTGIAEITGSAVRLTDGTGLPCHTAVWTAGVMASPLISMLGLETAASGQPLLPYRHRDLGLAVDLGGTQAVARPLGRHLSGLPAQLVTRGYHLYALPSPRARVRTAADWLMHATLGDDFTRLGLPDPMPGTLAGQEPAGQYLSGDDARQTAARILAHDQGGWLT